MSTLRFVRSRRGASSSSKFTSRTLFVATLLLAFVAGAAAETRIDLNDGWFFQLDPNAQGEAAGWIKQIPTGTESVRLPHTWNIGRYQDYEGIAWYFRSFTVAPELIAKHIELNIGASFYSSRIWLNGVAIGGHEGGYTSYHLDMTGRLQRNNYLAVAIDNRPGIATIPGFAMRSRNGKNIWYDWWHYGGLVRDVWISVNESVLIRRQQIRSEIVSESAVVTAHVFLENAASKNTRVNVQSVVIDPDGKTAASSMETLNVPRGTTDRVVRLQIGKANLWAISHPRLYQMRVDILDGSGKVLDQRSDTFGLRTIEIRDRHLLINGERVRLSGMTRHEDSPWEGLAETAGTMKHDYDDLKNLQVTLTRPVHYPQNPLIFDYADQNGMLLIPEIPVWQYSEKQLSDPKVLALAKQQMREMIEQDGNHPSVLGWSVCNESETYTAGGRAYFRAMRDFIREIDSGHFVSYADDSLSRVDRAEESAGKDADFLMMNEYFGSWHGSAEELSPSLDKVAAMFPDKLVIVSEFGTPGLFSRNKEEADRERIVTMRKQMKEFANRDWIGGAIFWCYQDYKSHRNLWPGLQEGYVDHGLVDENRQRRPSYDVWKRLNMPAAIISAWKFDSHVPAGFSATIIPNDLDHLPSFPLRDYSLSWEVRDRDGQILAHGERPYPLLNATVSFSADLPVFKNIDELELSVHLFGPTGGDAVETSLSWRKLHWGGQTVDQMKIPYPSE